MVERFNRKYELLRRVKNDGTSITDTPTQFGFCRLIFYRIQPAIGQKGISGLVQGRRGPKEAHKITHEILDFVRLQLLENHPTRTIAISQEIRAKFCISVHPRSLERAPARGKKDQK